MVKRTKKYEHAFWERNMWNHRIKILQEDYTVKYGKIGGFKTAEEAEESYEKYKTEFDQEVKQRFIKQNQDITLKDYLIYWYVSIFSERIKPMTQYITAYTVYSFLLPNIDDDIKIKFVSTEYLNNVLSAAAKYCESSGNKSREVLYIAFRDALKQRLVANNPVPATKRYPRKKPKVKILNIEQTRVLLRMAKYRNWFLEILLGLYCGLRKGEILGLKFSDFDLQNRTVHVQRQIAADMKLADGGCKIEEYKLVERDPKSENSDRILKVPPIILVELCKRRQKIEMQKVKMGDRYIDSDYISCQKNGLPHALASLNGELNRITKRAGLPHITVHGLRHMYATILIERGVSLAKISGLLGHGSVHTTFEFYLDIINGTNQIQDFMNQNFVPGEM